MTDPHADVQERLVQTHRRFEIARTVLAFICVAGMLVIGVIIVVMLSEARQGRAEIKSCIDPQGVCAQRGARQSVDLISASIVCSGRHLQTKEQAVACVKEVLGP